MTVTQTPNSSGARVPHQIAAQLARAEAILAESNPPTPAPSVPPVEATPPTTPPVVYSVETLLQAPDATRDNDVNYWRARANALAGYDRQNTATSKAKIEALEARIRDLLAKNTELVKSTPAAQPKINLEEHFSAEELELIPPDVATLIQRNIAKGQSTLEAELATIRNELATLRLGEKKTTEEAEVAAHRKFIEGLDSGFSNWAEVDKDLRWRSWLTIPDETTGIVRQAIVDRCKADKNPVGIVNLLKQFMITLAPATLPAEPPVNPPALGGTGGDAPTKPDPAAFDGRWMTDAEIKDGYKRKSVRTEGGPKMTPEEAAQFDARVAAQMKARGRG